MDSAKTMCNLQLSWLTKWLEDSKLDTSIYSEVQGIVKDLAKKFNLDVNAITLDSTPEKYGKEEEESEPYQRVLKMTAELNKTIDEHIQVDGLSNIIEELSPSPYSEKSNLDSGNWEVRTLSSQESLDKDKVGRRIIISREELSSPTDSILNASVTVEAKSLNLRIYFTKSNKDLTTTTRTKLSQPDLRDLNRKNSNQDLINTNTKLVESYPELRRGSVESQTSSIFTYSSKSEDELKALSPFSSRCCSPYYHEDDTTLNNNNKTVNITNLDDTLSSNQTIKNEPSKEVNTLVKRYIVNANPKNANDKNEKDAQIVKCLVKDRFKDVMNKFGNKKFMKRNESNQAIADILSISLNNNQNNYLKNNIDKEGDRKCKSFISQESSKEMTTYKRVYEDRKSSTMLRTTNEARYKEIENELKNEREKNAKFNLAPPNALPRSFAPYFIYGEQTVEKVEEKKPQEIATRSANVSYKWDGNRSRIAVNNNNNNSLNSVSIKAQNYVETAPQDFQNSKQFFEKTPKEETCLVENGDALKKQVDNCGINIITSSFNKYSINRIASSSSSEIEKEKLNKSRKKIHDDCERIKAMLANTPLYVSLLDSKLEKKTPHSQPSLQDAKHDENEDEDLDKENTTRVVHRKQNSFLHSLRRKPKSDVVVEEEPIYAEIKSIVAEKSSESSASEEYQRSNVNRQGSSSSVGTSDISSLISRTDSLVSLPPLKRDMQVASYATIVEEEDVITEETDLKEASTFNTTYTVNYTDNSQIIDEENRIKKLKREQSIQDAILAQAEKALTLCKQSKKFSVSREEVEAERAYLIASLRKKAITEEINKQQFEDKNNKENQQGMITISDILFPLKEDKKESTSKRTFYVCVVECGMEVKATEVVAKESNTFIAFENQFTFEAVSPDFEITITLYGLTMEKNSSSNSRRSFRRKTIGDDMYRSLRKSASRLSFRSSSNNDEKNKKQTSFKQFGRLVLKVDDLEKAKCTNIFDLTANTKELTGSVHLNMKEKIKFTERICGFLNVGFETNDFLTWGRKWCSLKKTAIYCWSYPLEEADDLPPEETIELQHCCQPRVEKANRETCSRPRCLEIEILNDPRNHKSIIRKPSGPIEKIYLQMDTTKDVERWQETLNKVLKTANDWRIQSTITETSV